MFFFIVGCIILALVCRNMQLSKQVSASTSIPRAKRNNNPGNLKFAGQKGAIGADKDGFAIFETEAAGWEALRRQIVLDESRGHTLSSFLYKYAPPTENNTAAYLQFVRSSLRLDDIDIPLKQIDTGELSEAIARMEGFYNA